VTKKFDNMDMLISERTSFAGTGGPDIIIDIERDAKGKVVGKTRRRMFYNENGRLICASISVYDQNGTIEREEYMCR